MKNQIFIAYILWLFPETTISCGLFVWLNWK